MVKRSTLRAGYVDVALRIQEAANELSASDVCARLRDALADSARGTGNWCYYIDHFGDADSGDVIYSCNGDTRRAPYSISGGDGAASKCVIDSDNSEDVVPRTIYEPEADEADHYAAMEEALVKTEKLYTEFPLYERFIAKKERDDADASDFAGKGRSFPILKPEDIPAAVHAMGRAGSGNLGPSGIKARIIAIAKRKGWTDKLPKSWQTGAAKENKEPKVPKVQEKVSESSFSGDVKLIESGAEFVGMTLLEAGAKERTSYPIKIIDAGTGSSAHYPASVLRKAAESGVFKPGTLMFWNHATAAEEAARPEGDLNNLAAITTSAGVWNDNGPKGPGIYAEAKPLAGYSEKLASMAPHIGVSIRAGGKGSGRTVDGKPELASIDYVESVDYVTKAGRGGMALAEAARDAGILISNEGGLSDMDAAEIKKLQESLQAQTAINERLVKRAMRADAIELGQAVLSTTSLNEAQRKFVIDLTVGTVEALRDLPMKEGSLDATKLTESLNANAKSYAATLPPSGRVIGMGAGPQRVEESAEQRTARESRAKEQQATDLQTLMELGLDESAAKRSLGIRAA